jgi:hypothetical protein
MIEGCENANLEGEAPLKPRAVRAELACARALLDELATVLEARNEERARYDMANQVADQLERVADTIRRWATARDHQQVLGSGS